MEINGGVDWKVADLDCSSHTSPDNMVKIPRHYHSCSERHDDTLTKAVFRINRISIMAPEENVIFLRIHIPRLLESDVDFSRNGL